MIIGLDFDNTIASYDDVIFQAAVERGLVDARTVPLKRQVRDRIRALPNGEIEWQKVQGLVYGPMMPKATLIEGVSDFVGECRTRGLTVYIVSHKTECAGYDETRTSLRDAALNWMQAKDFFSARGLGLDPGSVFFEDTREAKLQRIQALGCTHFVDDLEEVLSEPEFPPSVDRILYAPEAALDLSGPIKIVPDWRAMRDYFFAADRA
jgi:hypothetical protein